VLNVYGWERELSRTTWRNLVEVEKEEEEAI